MTNRQRQKLMPLAFLEDPTLFGVYGDADGKYWWKIRGISDDDVYCDMATGELLCYEEDADDIIDEPTAKQIDRCDSLIYSFSLAGFVKVTKVMGRGNPYKYARGDVTPDNEDYIKSVLIDYVKKHGRISPSIAHDLFDGDPKVYERNGLRWMSGYHLLNDLVQQDVLVDDIDGYKLKRKDND